MSTDPAQQIVDALRRVRAETGRALPSTVDFCERNDRALFAEAERERLYEIGHYYRRPLGRCMRPAPDGGRPTGRDWARPAATLRDPIVCPWCAHAEPSPLQPRSHASPTRAEKKRRWPKKSIDFSSATR